MDAKRKRRRSLRILKSAPVVCQEDAELPITGTGCLGSVWLGQTQIQNSTDFDEYHGIHSLKDPQPAPEDALPCDDVGISSVHGQPSCSPCQGLNAAVMIGSVDKQNILADVQQSAESVHQPEETWDASISIEVNREEDTETSLNNAILWFDQSSCLNDSGDISNIHSTNKQRDNCEWLSSDSPSHAVGLDTSVPIDNLNKNMSITTPSPSPVVTVEKDNDIPWLSHPEPQLTSPQRLTSRETLDLETPMMDALPETPVISALSKVDICLPSCLADADAKNCEQSTSGCDNTQSYRDVSWSDLCYRYPTVVRTGTNDISEKQRISEAENKDATEQITDVEDKNESELTMKSCSGEGVNHAEQTLETGDDQTEDAHSSFLLDTIVNNRMHSEFQDEMATDASNQDCVPLHTAEVTEYSKLSSVDDAAAAIKKSKEKKKRRRATFGADIGLGSFVCNSVQERSEDKPVLKELAGDSSNNNAIYCVDSNQYESELRNQETLTAENITTTDSITGVIDNSPLLANVDTSISNTTNRGVGQMQMGCDATLTQIDSVPEKTKKKRRRTADACIVASSLSENSSNYEDIPVGESTEVVKEGTTSRQRRSSLRLYRQQRSVAPSTVSLNDEMSSREETCAPLTVTGEDVEKQTLQGTEDKACGQPKDTDNSSIPPELQNLYRNKNYKRPSDKAWETIFEVPSKGKNTSKLKLKRCLKFEDHVPQSKLKRRWKKAVENGWNTIASNLNTVETQDVLEKLKQLDNEISETS